MATDYPRGIDVASYQGTPDWATVAADRVTFAMIKATQGTDYVNEMLVSQSKCRDAGLYRGFYHFARPDNNEPVDEAAHFLDIIGPYMQRGDVLALDLENYNGSLNGAIRGASIVEEWVWTWLSYVQARQGVKPLLYMNPAEIQQHGILTERLRPYPFWLADWGWIPDANFYAGRQVVIWQTGVAPSQAGIIGACDQDVFIGRVADFPLLGWQPDGAAPAPAPPTGEPTVPDGIFAGLTIGQLREKAEGLVNAVAYLGDTIGDSVDSERAELVRIQTALASASAELRRVRQESAGPRP